MVRAEGGRVIRELTPELLKQQAREAADQHIPLTEANHHTPGSQHWKDFNKAYREVSGMQPGATVWFAAPPYTEMERATS